MYLTERFIPRNVIRFIFHEDRFLHALLALSYYIFESTRHFYEGGGRSANMYIYSAECLAFASHNIRD